MRVLAVLLIRSLAGDVSGSALEASAVGHAHAHGRMPFAAWGALGQRAIIECHGEGVEDIVTV